MFEGTYSEDDARSIHPAFLHYKEPWKICRDFGNGELAVKGSGTRSIFLRLPHLTPAARMTITSCEPSFFPCSAAPLRLSSVLQFDSPLKFSGPTEVTQAFEDITLQGETIDGFIGNFLREILAIGRAIILVDVTMDEQAPTVLAHHSWRRAYHVVC